MANSPQNLVGPNARKLRVALGLSQEALAGRLQLMGWDLSRSGLSKIEAGLRRVNDAELWVLADALKVAITDLYPKSKTARGEVVRQGG